VLLRILVGFGVLIWLAIALILFAKRVGTSYALAGGCRTAGAPGTIWAVATGLITFVGVASGLGFAIDPWGDDHPPDRHPADRALAVACVCFVVWLGLVPLIPSVHSCGA
jgi:hypothetical protein